MATCMISAPQPEAVEAGLETFKRSGNVMDAAIAAAMVQTVVDPQMCGIAGFGSMQIIRPATGESSFIDFHGSAPLALPPALLRERHRQRHPGRRGDVRRQLDGGDGG